MPSLAICNQALSGAIISVHLCPFYQDLVVLKFSFYRLKPIFSFFIYLFEKRCHPCHPLVMCMVSLMSHHCAI